MNQTNQSEYRLALAVKAVDPEAGTFEGFAAVYGNTDRQGDKIVPGAFAGDAGREVTLLWSHKTDEVIGVGTLEETSEGVRVKGRLLLDTVAGKEAYSRLESGAARGLSVGLRVLKHAWDGAVRLIRAAQIAEVSVVAFPANERALVSAVKEGECPLAPVARILRPDWNLFRPPG